MLLQSAPLSIDVFGALSRPPVAHRDYLGDVEGGGDDSSSQKTTYHYKLFRVRRSDGRVTTVSLNPVLVATACKHMGVAAVQTAVKSAAAVFVDGTPGGCSKWCAAQLLESLRKAEVAHSESADATEAADALEPA